ncbi:hypothetical protein K504DRAFT_424239 [Pleomassaria siparia CBS 279.74]|uniref:Ecp2 effector protein domain-containing protein n=1 Tax=Pleomassaria siparia CBS 279.74 TaxID=1314801 RepID=A0A6G1KL53_9PLEO|nr:hypothetical protein K504DRAFT_424239 [Pleomassaria siparia CBS 279.74]
MKSASLSILAFALGLTTSVQGSVVFSLSTLPNGQGERKSWVVDRWKCHDLAPDGIDNKASWAFVDVGLANGCELYDNNNCTGASVFIEKNNSNILGPGPVNLTDVAFDKMASSFECF